MKAGHEHKPVKLLDIYARKDNPLFHYDYKTSRANVLQSDTRDDIHGLEFLEEELARIGHLHGCNPHS